MHWLTITALIVGLLLAFLTGRMLRKGGRQPATPPPRHQQGR
jgi:hypothetical protein